MPAVDPGATVAVTGATGFIGSHVCAALLASGFRVRAVVRDPKDESKSAHLVALPKAAECLSLWRGDLGEQGSYDEAFEGADAVVHTAAVVEINNVKDPEAQIVKPSVDGVQNVLASAEKSSTVRRFVHTSSEIAVQKWDEALDSTFSEESWNTASTLESGDPYGYAKVQAERLALDHKSSHFDVVSILPGVNLGPCMTKTHTKASAVVVRQMLFGNSQFEYHAHFVDVRDTALAHVRAVSAIIDDGANRRFLVCIDEAMQISELEAPLRRLFPEYVIEAKPYPGFALKALMRVPLLWRAFTTEFQKNFMDHQFRLDNSKAKSKLSILYRPFDETLEDTVKSMVDTGFVKARTK